MSTDATVNKPASGDAVKSANDGDGKLEEIRSFVDSLSPEELTMLQEYVEEKTQAAGGDNQAQTASGEAPDVVDLSQM